MRPIVRQALVFGLVGVANTAVHFIVFVVLLRALSVPLLAASGLGYLAGMTNSYLMNRRWTFRARTTVNFREILSFVLVNGLSLAVNLLVLNYAVRVIGVLPEIGQALAIVASLAANFAGNKWWVFRAQG